MSGSALSNRLRRGHNPWIGSIEATTGDDLVVTFDDGPDPEQTPRVLESLARHRATATFFVLLTRARRHPALIHSIVEAGHEVGLHGHDHRPMTEFSHRDALVRTARAKEELEVLTGSAVRWFRPPYGRQSLSSHVAVHRAGLTTVLWSATTWDWKDVAPAQRLAKALEGATPGAILLAHDGFADFDDGADDGEPALRDRAGLVDQVLAELGSRRLTGRSVGAALGRSAGIRTLRFARGSRSTGGTAASDY